MYAFGERSKSILLTCRPDLVTVAQYVMDLQIMDFAIICGHRDEEAQLEAYMTGKSKVLWPKSKHNMTLSNAFDFAPWVRLPDGKMGIPWEDTESFAMLGGMFLAAGAILKKPVRYGGDWDGDGSTRDQSLMDWGHIEVAK